MTPAEKRLKRTMAARSIAHALPDVVSRIAQHAHAASNVIEEGIIALVETLDVDELAPAVEPIECVTCRRGIKGDLVLFGPARRPMHAFCAASEECARADRAEHDLTEANLKIERLRDRIAELEI